MGSSRAGRDRAGSPRWGRLALVLLLAAGLVAALAWVGWRLSDSPERARRTWAEALAAGHVDQLRAVSVLPGDVLATDQSFEALRTRGAAALQVRATATGASFMLGGSAHELPLPVVKSDGRWRVEGGVAALDLAGFPGAVAVDGLPVRQLPVLLWPGVHEVTSADPLLTFTPVPVLADGRTATRPAGAVVPSLTAVGEMAVREAASGSLRTCLAGRELAVPGCPNTATPPPGLSIKPGTVSWQLAGTDPTSSLRVALSPGVPWGISEPLHFSLRVQADAVRRTDGTSTRYDQTVPVVVQLRAAVAQGAVSVVWQEP